MSEEMPAWAERNSTPMMPEEIAAQKYWQEMPSEEVLKYSGEWIAIWGSEVVAHGKDPRVVEAEAHKAGAKSPFLERIYQSPSEVPYFYI